MDKIVCCTNLTLFGGAEIESEQYIILCQGMIFNVFFQKKLMIRKKGFAISENLGHIFFSSAPFPGCPILREAQPNYQ